ncbi:MAG: 50S ribosomal protein L9 [Coriobacteriales bacterium]|jgi:large subunit ribosomal protein L9|nr:50S ribosomal protein L9 [Coriobacteriales bacterium]
MKVILLQELKGRGGEGDVVEVATGFAVNYLFPRKIALEATKGNLKQLELRKHNIEKRESERLDTADKMFAALDQKTIKIGAKVGEEGQLFGSVTAQQVTDALNEQFGTQIDRKKVDLHGTIKTAGEHVVTVAIYREVKANVIVEVVDEKSLNSAQIIDEAVEAAQDALKAVANEPVEAIEKDGVATEDELSATEEILGEVAGELDAAVAVAVEEVAETALDEAASEETGPTEG